MFSAITRRIASGDITVIDKSIGIENLSESGFTTLVVSLVLWLYETRRGHLVSDIIEQLQEANKDEELAGVLLRIGINIRITPEIVNWLHDNDVNLVHMAEQISQYDGNEYVEAALTKIFDVINPDIDTLNALLSVAIMASNDKAITVISKYRGRVSASISVPEYVKNTLGLTRDEQLALLPEPKKLHHNKGELVMALGEGLYPNIDDYDNNLVQLATEITDDNVTETDELFFTVWAGEQDENLARVLGPSNQYCSTVDIDDEFDTEEDSYCSLYGGCRMLTCIHFELDEPDVETETIGDWFTGYCRKCDNQIPNRYCAVRKPVYRGGWMHCYCSWGCVRDSISQESNLAYPYDMDNDVEEPKKIVEDFLVGAFERYLDKVGIEYPKNPSVEPNRIHTPYQIPDIEQEEIPE